MNIQKDENFEAVEFNGIQDIKDIKSKNIRMHEMLIPISMALITDFNEKYLGVEK